MSFPKILLITIVLLFAAIGLVFLFKKEKGFQSQAATTSVKPVEIELDKEFRVLPPADAQSIVHSQREDPIPTENLANVISEKKLNEPEKELPDANRIEQLFSKNDPKLPIVETIVYRSRVAWQKGRPAWLSDYASHYRTSRHFIARSLNGSTDYLKQDLAEGDRFNVFRQDKNFSFYLLIDILRCKLWFYYLDLDSNERVLLKTYQVVLGRLDHSKASGSLTPLGKFTLGDRIAIYRPKMMGNYNGQQIEMVRVFGSRWIPFEKEVSECSAPAKGFGIHGTPWILNDKKEAVQDNSSLGKYESDGCVRLSNRDVEEIFAIVITRPTIVELVKDFYDARLPGEGKE